MQKSIDMYTSHMDAAKVHECNNNAIAACGIIISAQWFRWKEREDINL